MEFRNIAASAAVLLSLQLGLPAVAQAEKLKLPAEKSGLVEGREVPEPISISPVDGMLALTLTAKPSKVEIAGKSFVTNVYNGMYHSPRAPIEAGG